MDCPKCGARIRLRRPSPKDEGGDGFLRFHCPCGRRLKVPVEGRPTAGKCPDCGRIVPVPTSIEAIRNATTGKKPSLSNPEARTDELDAHDLAQLEKWAARHPDPSPPGSPFATTTGFTPVASSGNPAADVGLLTPNMLAPSVVKFEAGLRVCPRCKKPVHMGATNCRECGTPVPRQ
jgi:ribosomal protein L40E